MIPNYELARALREGGFTKATFSGFRIIDADKLALWLQTYVTISSNGKVKIKEYKGSHND